MKPTTIKTYLTGKLTLVEIIKFILVAMYSWLGVLTFVLIFLEEFVFRKFDPNTGYEATINPIILDIPLLIIFFGFLVGIILKIYNLILKK